MKIKLLLLLLLPTLASAQYCARRDDYVTTAMGQAVPGATVTYFAQPGLTVTTVYSSAACGAPSAQFALTDGFGHATAYLAPGLYTVVYSGAVIQAQTLTDQPVGIAANLAAPGDIGTSVPAQGFFTNLKSQSLNKDYWIDGFAGSDWCAQAVTTYTAHPATRLHVNNNVSNMNACSVPILLPANTHLIFDQPGTYILGTNQIAPAGANVSIQGTGWDTILSYTGTSSNYAIDINTEANSRLDNFQITLGTAAAGGVRYQHQTSGSNANEYARRVRVLAPVYTAGQIGVDLHNHTLNDSNYRNDLEFFTDNVDIGAQFDSDVNDNGSNGNRLFIACDNQSRCVNMLDGTDNLVTVLALGAHNFSVGSLTLTSVATSGGNAIYTGTITGGGANALVGTVFHVTGFTNAGNNGWFIASASSGTTITAVNAGVVGETHAGAAIAGGIAFDACDVGTAGYGVSNDTAWMTSEQGGGSGTVVIHTGNGTCGVATNFFGNSSDATNFSDANGKAFAFFGNALYQPVIANNSFCMGGQCSASDVAVVRNGTFFDFMLGDQSADTLIRASRFVINDGSSSAAITGAVALPRADCVSWRNQSNNADDSLCKNSNDSLSWNAGAGTHVIPPVERGNCVMSSGTCTFSFSASFSSTPVCTATWNGTGTLTGIVKAVPSLTNVVVTSSGGSDSATMQVHCDGSSI